MNLKHLLVSYLKANAQLSVGNQTPVSLPGGLHATILRAPSFVIKGIGLTNTTMHDFGDHVCVSVMEL